ncbi:R.Pab1 family restriction endonuclease [Mycoplasmopsis primatum]|uniref:R.Pab1 family restriction endonuclease n=1 Tax=Mycoplasmopsis primatum TaxID=55604 RepID=UPI0004952051|nr:R.Pab1 family restriction endonuclease [Mycoplasmopsis primatum]
MFDANLITISEIEKLITDFNQSKTSLENEFQIQINKVKNYVADGNISFCQQDINLPTFIYSGNNDYSYIEVSIEKQQYASGVQPMLYFSIPIKSLTDGEEMIGKTAKNLNFSYTTFVIDKTNKDCLLNMFRIFGICSAKHKYDIQEILKLLVQNYDKKNK